MRALLKKYSSTTEPQVLPQKVFGFKKLESCSTDGRKSVATFIHALAPLTEENCKKSCEQSPQCDFFIYKPDETMFTCFFGDIDGANHIPVSLTGNVDVHLKDPSESTNEAFKSCQLIQSASTEITQGEHTGTRLNFDLGRISNGPLSYFLV